MLVNLPPVNAGVNRHTKTMLKIDLFTDIISIVSNNEKKKYISSLGQ